jgi:hypothetical protein
MARGDTENQELLTKNENLDVPEDQSELKGEAGAREKSGKVKSSETKGYQRKKQDALQGKGNKQSSNSEEDSQTGGRAKGGGADEKGGGKGGSGPTMTQSLQSGQTTVQFSSGGGAGNLGSLLALFASSANMTKADVGAGFNIANQSNTLNLRTALQVTNTGSLLGVGKEAKELVATLTDQKAEIPSPKFINLELGSNSSHSLNSSQNVRTALFTKFNDAGALGAGDQGTVPSETTIFNLLKGSLYIQPFNSGGVFFAPAIIFTFPNTATPYAGVVTSYFNAVPNLKSADHYTYQVLSPILTGTVSTRAHGNNPLLNFSDLQNISSFTVTSSGGLATNITRTLRFGDTDYSGLTLTAAGDVQANNLLYPTSILVRAFVGNSVTNSLVFRVDAGPGTLVTSGSNGIMQGTVDPLTGAFSSTGTVLRSSGNDTIIGDGANISVAVTEVTAGVVSPAINTITYTGPDAIRHTFGFSMDTNTYMFPSNTIFRHTGSFTTDAQGNITATLPTQPAYGNFDVATVQVPSPFNLTFGGNVLDVYGTMYGSGETLNLVPLPAVPGSPISVPAIGQTTINMGENTLGGIGTFYGDVKTLNLLNVTDGPIINFLSNSESVDKSVGSTLYPHIQTLFINGAVNNMEIHFQNSIIQGNTRADTFYGEIPILGDLSQPVYNGFIKGVTVNNIIDANERHLVEITTNDLSHNKITWGNDIYVGGYQPLNDPLSVKDLNGNTYHFTLLGNTAASPLPIKDGNSLIVDFNKEFDTLDFQLTPALFKALQGADGQGHNKTITIADLNTVATFAQMTPSSLQNTDPLFVQYLQQYLQLTNPGPIGGTTIMFAGGGSLALQGLNLTRFSDFASITTEVNITYVPVAALAANTIAATTVPLQATPQLDAPFVYGNAPNYFNELDNYFSNSLFATYSVAGLPAGVSIDTWGTITVHNTTPTFVPLTITATDQNAGTATSGPLLFGFLDAPIRYGAPGVETVGLANGPTILVGGSNSTLVGHAGNAGLDNFVFSSNSTGATSTIASSLIVDTSATGTATAYGDYKTIAITANGISNFQFTADHFVATQNGSVIVQGSPANLSGVINNYTLNINGNASYVNGTTYGVANSLTLNALGGNASSVNIALFSTLGPSATTISPDAATIPFYDGAALTNSTINIAARTLLGSGTLIGGVNEIDINATSGLVGGFNGFTFTRNAQDKIVTGTSATLDTSSSVTNNSVIFHPATITVTGDATGQTTTIVESALKLDMQFVGYDNPRYYSGQISVATRSAQDLPPPAPPAPPPLNYAQAYSIATISNNHLIFEGSTLTGGKGNTNFFGNLSELGDPNNPIGYPGFVTGVSVSIVNGIETITTGTINTSSTSFSNNSITYANNTFVGGLGWNHYNFTLVPDLNLKAVGQGFQEITNFNPVKDSLIFNIGVNLFANLGMNAVPNDLIGLATRLDRDVTVGSDGVGGTLITFTAGGGIDLKGMVGFTSLAGIASAFPGFTPIIIQSIGSPYVPVAFNPQGLTNYIPVFANGNYLSLFQGLAPNSNPLFLSYSVAGVTGTPNPTTPGVLNYAIAPGITLTSTGALDINLTTGIPLFTTFSLTVSDGTTSFTTPTPIPIFALNTTTREVNSNTTNLPLSAGSTNTEAFYSATSGDSILGGGEDITFTPVSPQTITTYGAKLIYDVGPGSHMVIGDIQSIYFDTTNGTGTGATNQNINFGVNLIYTNGSIYGNVQNLFMTGTGITGNSFTFANDQLYGVTGANSFFGHMQSFGTTQNKAIDVVNGFYKGVTVTTNTVGGETFMTITDANNNAITWGNNTYTGGAGINTYNYTIVANNAATPQAVGQGFDSLKNLAVGDRFVFNLPYNFVAALSPAGAMNFAAFLPQLVLTLVGNNDVITFAGGGSLTLLNAGPAFTLAQLGAVTTFSIIDAPTLIAAPTSNVMIFGHTTSASTYSGLFDTNNALKMLLSNGITLNVDGTVNYGTNTGIINSTLPSVTDLYTGLTVTTPVRVLALDAPLIDTQTGIQTGGTEADIFHAYGNITTGGGADIVYGATNASIATTGGSVGFANSPDTNPPATVSYGSKVIYDVVSSAGSVAADVNNIIFETQGWSNTTFNGAGADGSSTLQDKTINFGSNYIEIAPTPTAPNLNLQKTYGNFQKISFTALGGQAVINTTTSIDDAKILNNTITTAGNTIKAAGSLFGDGDQFKIEARDGYYSNSSTFTTQPSDAAVISGNHLTAAGNTLVGTGTGTDILYGDFNSISFQVALHNSITLTAPNGIVIGNGLIENNVMTFGSNTLTGNIGTSNLYLSVKQLILMNNEIALTAGQTQDTPSEISGNQFIFQNSQATALGGITNFYDEVDNFSQTNFYQYAVTATMVGGHLQVTDMPGTGALNFADSTVHGNTVLFGNDTMNGSTLATSANIFNLDLLVTPTTTTTTGSGQNVVTTTNYGHVVPEGTTIINNFGASSNNILNLELSHALYLDILAQAGITPVATPTPITGAMMDAYLAATGGKVTDDTTNHITTISFTDGATTPTTYGSIILNGFDLNGAGNASLHKFGSQLHITAEGITTIDPPSSEANIYNVAVSGDSLSSYTQNASIINTDSLGHIVDFSGTVDINLSTTLFKALGLSDANTAAQNVQILEHDAATGLGGLAISTVASGTGESAVTNTVLTFEATNTGVVTNYGSITLMHTTFTAVNPVENHILISHA